MKVPIDEIYVKAERTRSFLDADSDEMLELVESIRAIGLINPITVTKERELIAGERRLVACRLAGLAEVEVRISEADPLQVEIEENTKRLALPWPDRARAEVRLWNRMKEKDPAWTAARQAGLSTKSTTTIYTFLRLGRALATKPYLEEIASYTEAMKLLEEEEKREEELPGIAHYIVHAPGWAQERYVVGDALVGLEEFVASQPQQRGVACHLADVDPPRRARPVWSSRERSSLEEHLRWENFLLNYQIVSKLVYDCLMPNAFAIFWYEMPEHYEILSLLRRTGWTVEDIPGLWIKHQLSATPKPDTLLGTAFEPFFIARKGKPRLGRPGRGNVFNYPDAQKIHPHEKTYRLCEEIVRTFLFPGSRVVIPFLGSGNMLRAATAAGHMAFGWEIEAEHKDRFLKRVEEDRMAFDKQQRELGLKG